MSCISRNNVVNFAVSVLAAMLLVACAKRSDPATAEAVEKKGAIQTPVAKQNNDASEKISRFAEERAEKFGLGYYCDKVINVASEVVKEGVMNGGSEGFNGRVLPAVVVSVSATCIRQNAGLKIPYSYTFVSAYDREFEMARSIDWFAVFNGDIIGKEDFDRHLTKYFKPN